MFYNQPSDELLPHKDELIARKIKKFDDSNWYMWGRGFYKSNQERIYVNAKTRNANPFFYHPCKAYDGSVLAIFPKEDVSADKCKEIAEMLNRVNWKELGFVCDGRYLFSQQSLENSILPDAFVYNKLYAK